VSSRTNIATKSVEYGNKNQPKVSSTTQCIATSIVVEALDLNKRDNNIIVVPRGIDPPFGLDAILIELLHSSEK
jgi:hypothetical protein